MIARLTYHDSYPDCCPRSPTYDPNASKSECLDYSGCKYIGDFAAIGHQSLEYVQSNNLVSFFDSNHSSSEEWAAMYANRTIQI